MRYVVLLPLPAAGTRTWSNAAGRRRLAITTLTAELARSITWDQGKKKPACAHRKVEHSAYGLPCECVVSSVRALCAMPHRVSDDPPSIFSLVRVPVVVRGGVEPPTFRFSGLSMTVQGWPRWSPDLLGTRRWPAMDRGTRTCMRLEMRLQNRPRPGARHARSVAHLRWGPRTVSAGQCAGIARGLKSLADVCSPRFARDRSAGQVHGLVARGWAWTRANCNQRRIALRSLTSQQ